jgi:fido (protein-threonine AMPylation protein)
LAIPWNDDPPADLPVLRDNLRKLLLELVEQAEQRSDPSIEMAQEWHRRIYAGVSLRVHYYAGEVRNSDPEFPELIGYEVHVGTRLGVLSEDVPAELQRFEAATRRAVGILDRRIPTKSPISGEQELHSVLTLCAYTHGEWVRIHPFANGNGRTARVWANWCALRYGLPPFVRLKPRPEGSGYATAAAESMAGDHRGMVGVFLRMLDENLADR